MKSAQVNSKALLRWLAITFILALLVSCSINPENAIVGKWSSIDGTKTMEFFKDGTVQEVDKEKRQEESIFNPNGPFKTVWVTEVKAGDYKFIEKNRIKLIWGGLDGFDGPIVDGVSISEDELTLTMPDGKVSKYRRVK